MAVLAMRRSTHGVSGSFMVRADDGGDYWCKVTNNPTSPRIPVNEQVAGRLGIALGVSVATPALVKLDGIAGWEFHPGLHVEAGWAHGCAAVPGAFETRSLEHRSHDDNRKRHAGFYALMGLARRSRPAMAVLRHGAQRLLQPRSRPLLSRRPELDA